MTDRSELCALDTGLLAAEPHFLIGGGNKNKSIKTKPNCFCQRVGTKSMWFLFQRKQCCLKFAASFSGKLLPDVWKTEPGSSHSDSTAQSCKYRRSQIGISWVLTIPSCLGMTRLRCQTSGVVEGKDVSSVLFGRLPPWHRSVRDILHGSRGTL